jgi:hypothetical protein
VYVTNKTFTQGIISVLSQNNTVVGYYPKEAFISQEELFSAQVTKPEFAELNFAKKQNPVVKGEKVLRMGLISGTIVLMLLIALKGVNLTGAHKTPRTQKAQNEGTKIEDRPIQEVQIAPTEVAPAYASRSAEPATPPSEQKPFTALIITPVKQSSGSATAQQDLESVGITQTEIKNTKSESSEETVLYFLHTVPEPLRTQLRTRLSLHFKNVVELQTDQPADADITVTLGEVK